MIHSINSSLRAGKNVNHLLMKTNHRLLWVAAASTTTTTFLSNCFVVGASTNTCTATTAAGSSSQFCSSTSKSNNNNMVKSYPLVDKWQQSKDSWVLRFGLPPDQKYLGNDPTLPTCISVHHNDTLAEEKEDGGEVILKKSYSPISHPATEGTFDLLVKAYTPVPGGGVGHGICNLQVGEGELVGKLKKERLIHNSPIIHRRWDHIGLVGGGTGIAPLIQLARICLGDSDDETKISILSINRNEDDILMKDELDKMANDYPDRVTVNYSLTGSNLRKDWDGYTGRGSVDMIQKTLPPPTTTANDTDADEKMTTMIFVCGTDGFRDMWAGPIARAPPLPDGSRGPKIQGPLLGLLKDAGYEASDVFKY